MRVVIVNSFQNKSFIIFHCFVHHPYHKYCFLRMSLHNCSVFKNSCIKPPIHPVSRMPTPCYERRKKYATVKTGISKSMNNLNKVDDDGEGRVDGRKPCRTSDGATQNDNFMSLIDFYESIPGKFALYKYYKLTIITKSFGIIFKYIQ